MQRQTIHPATARSRVMIGLLALASAAASAAGQTYHVIDLGTLGGLGDADAFAILGSTTPATVVGFATDFTQNHRALLSYSGASGPIPPLAPDVQNVAFAIDGFGQVYGVSYVMGNVQPRAFLANSAGETSLGNFVARGCNAAGDVVGNMPVLQPDGLWDTHACLRLAATGTLTDLGTLGPTATNSSAFAVNESGLVVGQSSVPGNIGTKAVSWAGGAIHELGTLGGNAGGAHAVNNNNLAVGWGRTSGATATNHAVKFNLSPAGALVAATDLGSLPALGSAPAWSYAYGVNDAGVIVGQSSVQGFIVFPTGLSANSMQSLNSLLPASQGWTVVSARAVDQQRRIAGMAVNNVNLPRPVLLVPCDADANRDGAVTVQDVFDYLTLWFAAAPRADVNFDAAVSVQDVFEFLAQWFQGCEG